MSKCTRSLIPSTFVIAVATGGALAVSLCALISLFSPVSPMIGRILVSIGFGIAYGIAMFFGLKTRRRGKWVVLVAMAIVIYVGSLLFVTLDCRKETNFIVILQLRPGAEQLHYQMQESAKSLEQLGEPWSLWLKQMAKNGITGELRLVGLIAGVSEIEGSFVLVTKRRPESELAFRMSRDSGVIYFEHDHEWEVIPHDVVCQNRKLYFTWPASNRASVSIPLSNGMVNKAEMMTTWGRER